MGRCNVWAFSWCLFCRRWGDVTFKYLASIYSSGDGWGDAMFEHLASIYSWGDGGDVMFEHLASIYSSGDGWGDAMFEHLAVFILEEMGWCDNWAFSQYLFFRRWGDATFEHLAGISRTEDAAHCGVALVSGYFLYEEFKPVSSVFYFHNGEILGGWMVRVNSDHQNVNILLWNYSSSFIAIPFFLFQLRFWTNL